MPALKVATLLGLFVCLFGPGIAPVAAEKGTDKGYEARRAEYLANYAKRPLKQGPNPRTWVDVERWCVAHACLATGTRLDEANQYLSEVQWASLWHGLVADSDVQVTDLLRTYLEFRESDLLSGRAKTHLKQLFEGWQVPNTDRNRRADETYQWPCEYTENHSLNILAGSYLIDTVLGRDRSLRKGLLQRFLQDRAKWGWSEFHSPNYAAVTAKALTCLVDFAPDKPIAESARMSLDILAYEFANHSLRHWRGVPFARGARSQSNNASNSFYELARLWFGDRAENAQYRGGNFLAHLLTSKYRPPEGADWLVNHPDERGRYVMNEVATTGPAKLRVPIVTYVAPNVTMASAQGCGSYYDGCYWSISFASSPGNVITGTYPGGRNILQRGNVMAVFGAVSWHGKLQKGTDGNTTIGGDGKAFVGQIDLDGECHVLMVGDVSEYADEAAFRRAFTSLGAQFDGGVVFWTMPNGKKVRMVNERCGAGWRLVSAWQDDRRIRPDTNLLYDSPQMRSVRGSAQIEVLHDGRKQTYDFCDPEKPRVRTSRRAKLSDLPPDTIEGPLGMQFLHIPAGEFPMGSEAAEGRENERPQRWVHVDGFYVSKTEVKVGQYKQFLAKNPKIPPPPEQYFEGWAKTDDYPMGWVSWDEADAFCTWLSKQDKHTYRLPTEAEWEKAAKGYAHRVYPWGADYDGSQSGTRNGTYAPVGAKATDCSPFGVLDLAGNVWEWCSDWFAPDAYRTGPVRNPRGPETGQFRSLRGCGWNFDPDTFRCSYRSRWDPKRRSIHIGFRVVRELQEK